MNLNRFLIFTILLSLLISFPILATAEYGDVIMKNKEADMKEAEIGNVVFPHWIHRIRYKCKACHEELFIMLAGKNNTDMEQIDEGKSCGKCHNGTIAWATGACERCHIN